jgi:hypothetical protein
MTVGLHSLRDHVPIDLAGLAGAHENDVETLCACRDSAATRQENAADRAHHEQYAQKSRHMFRHPVLVAKLDPRPLTFGKIRRGSTAYR